VASNLTIFLRLLPDGMRTCRFMPVTNAEGTKMLGVLSLRELLMPLWS
jgi:hypothetical protein